MITYSIFTIYEETSILQSSSSYFFLVIFLTLYESRAYLDICYFTKG